MATRGAKFSAIPNIPQQGLSDWQFQTLNAMKENLDMLTGARGPALSALTRGAVTVSAPATQTMQRVTAAGTGFTISGVTVPSLDDYAKLLENVQQVANDVAALRNTVNALLVQLKGQ